MRDGTEWDGMNNGCSFMVMVGAGIAAVGVYDFPHCDSFGDVPRARAASYFKMVENSRKKSSIVKLISMKEDIWCAGLSLGFSWAR